MSMIDWSDPEEMLGLLVDYVRDQESGEQRDRERARFLRSLASSVEVLGSSGASSPRSILDHLRSIADEQPAEFDGDVVMTHVRDCIAELERIAST